MDKEVHEAFTEKITEYFANAQTVCTRPLLEEGGRAAGSEATVRLPPSVFACCKQSKLDDGKAMK